MKEERAEERNRMVDEQIAHRGVSDRRVIEAMRRVPRHAFVPEHLEGRAYADMAMPIGEGQTISQPFMVAIMTESLKLTGRPGERVLEIGTGSGYQAAVLAEIAEEVYTIERVESLARRAEKIVRSLGYENVTFKVGDGTRGWPGPVEPFDRIIVTAGAPVAPESLKEQLADGGILVIPVGDRTSQNLKRITRLGEEFLEETLLGCMFVPLVGEEGWEG